MDGPWKTKRTRSELNVFWTTMSNVTMPDARKEGVTLMLRWLVAARAQVCEGWCEAAGTASGGAMRWRLTDARIRREPVHLRVRHLCGSDEEEEKRDGGYRHCEQVS